MPEGSHTRILRAVPILIAASLWAVPARAQYSGGTGEPNDPYRIATAADLIALGETPEDYDKHFILTADIDLDPNLPGRKVFDRAVIAPDTNDMADWFQGIAFTGVFDGNGRNISHLTINGSAYLGLFGQLSSRSTPAGEVMNLGIVDVNIVGSGGHVGGLVGTNGGEITDCYSLGTVGGGSSVGGLVGTNHLVLKQDRRSSKFYSGRVVQCYSASTVTGNVRVGGLVGWNSGGITDCYSTSVVSGDDSVGGLVGGNWVFSYALGKHYVATGSVTRSYSTSAVSGNSAVGGLVGSNTQRASNGALVVGVVSQSLWDIQTSGQATSDGGVGKATAEMCAASTFLSWGRAPTVWTIDEGVDYPRLAWEDKPGKPLPALEDFLIGSGDQGDPYLICTADDLNTIGAFPCDWDKYFKLMADIDLSSFDGKDGRPAFNIIGSYEHAFSGVFDGNGFTISHLTVIGDSYLGLFGHVTSEGEVRDVGVVDVNVSRLGKMYPGGKIGGLAGYSSGSVIRCYSTGAVNGDGSDAGGLLGGNLGIVAYCYSTCAVAGGNDVGGLLGVNHRSLQTGSVTHSYSSGPVSGHQGVGGLVGDNRGNVSQCHSTGEVNGDTHVGGLVGWNWAPVTLCFWDTQTSGQATSAGGTGKTTTEMQMAGTFLDAGWDFVGETANGTEDIWWIDEGTDYPRLWWEPGD